MAAHTAAWCGSSSWGPWRNKDELTECFEDTVLIGGVPFVVNIISLLVIGSKHLLRKREGFIKLNEEEASDESADEVDENQNSPLFATPESQRSSGRLLGPKALFYVLGVHLVQLSFYCYIAWKAVVGDESQGFFNHAVLLPIAGLFSWTYTFILIINQLLRPCASSAVVRVHLFLIFLASSISSILNLRSTLLDHARRGVGNQDESIIFGIATGLTAIVCYLIAIKKSEKKLSINKERQEVSHEKNASIYDMVYFSWFDHLIYLGSKQTLSPKDLWSLLPEDTAKAIAQTFSRLNQKTLGRKLFCAIRWRLLRQAFFGFVWATFSFSGPFFVKRILTYVEDPSKGTLLLAYTYAFGLFGGSLLATMAFGQALWDGRKMDVHVKGMIMSAVYAKALRRRDMSPVKTKKENEDQARKDNEESEDNASTGKIVNLMAVDSGKVSLLAAYAYELWTAPLRIVLASTLLYSLLGWSFLVGLATQILLQPVVQLLVKSFRSHHQALRKLTDSRITRIGEIMGAIKILKFFAWEEKFIQQIGEIRNNELIALRRRLYDFIYFQTASTFIPLSTTIVTLGTYTMIAKQTLTATVGFTSVALFFQLRAAIGSIPNLLNWYLQCKVSLERIEKYLNEDETQKYAINSNDHNTESIKIGFKNATFAWFTGEPAAISADPPNPSPTATAAPATQQGPFTLRNLNITFPVGEMTLISGSTGSGKSSLIMALLGEMDCKTGSRYLPNNLQVDLNSGLYDGVAYVPQTAWLQNATIRDNITFGSPYDDERYSKVIYQCALRRDFEILEGGDMTEVGEKGITLSGGQKQRVSLARAVYSRAATVLLDDCLSAVDAHTGKHILENCFMGDLMNSRTRILVTHHVGMCLKAVKHMVVLSKGAIIANGEVSSVLKSGVIPAEFLEEHSKVTAEGSDGEPVVEELLAPEQDTISQNARAETKRKDKGKLIMDESRATGSVKLSVYTRYLKETGGALFIMLVLSCYIAAQFVSVYQDYWIKIWTSRNADANVSAANTQSTYSMALLGLTGATSSADQLYPAERSTDGSSMFSSFISHPGSTIAALASHSGAEITTTADSTDAVFYLGMYAVIGILALIVRIISMLLSYHGSLKASRKLHGMLLRSILYAPMRFFDTTPLGRITNRFSKDIDSVDDEVNTCAIFLVTQIFSLFSIILIIVSVTPSFLIAAVFIAMIYGRIGQLYLNASREIKRIESVARSPIYSHFAESIVGVSTIRAYNAESRFTVDNICKIDQANGPFLWLWGANRWLSVRMDTGGALVSCLAAVFIVMNLSKGNFDAGLAGLSLSYALQFNDAMLWIVRFYSTNEMNMNSVERLQEYIDLKPEAPSVIEGNRPPAAWPENGEIEVKDLVLQYSAEHPPVLKNVNFHVKPGQRIGIVGRTGAGKSTLAVAFFRILEPVSGSIFIDNVDISKIGLADLRSRLTIIPQDPVLFTGNIRNNLDPFNTCSDEALFATLRRVHLISADEETQADASLTVTSSSSSSNSNPFLDLDNPVNENGTNFSQGQRQLMSLARALLVSRKVIIMDEATASVDFETDAKIQTTIREEFVDKGCTILTIAHRLRTIIDYDMVLVMDAGTVAQFDTPYNLIRQEGIFKEMCLKSGGEYNGLLELAKIAQEGRN